MIWEIWFIFQSSRCRFLSYSKNYTCTFMQDNSWHYKLFQFHLSFRTWKVWKGRGKMLKNWISPERKELFRWHKNHSYSFWRAIIWWKNKNLIKNSGYKLWQFSQKCSFVDIWRGSKCSSGLLDTPCKMVQLNNFILQYLCPNQFTLCFRKWKHYIEKHLIANLTRFTHIYKYKLHNSTSKYRYVPPEWHQYMQNCKSLF